MTNLKSAHSNWCTCEVLVRLKSQYFLSQNAQIWAFGVEIWKTKTSRNIQSSQFWSIGSFRIVSHFFRSFWLMAGRFGSFWILVTTVISRRNYKGIVSSCSAFVWDMIRRGIGFSHLINKQTNKQTNKQKSESSIKNTKWKVSKKKKKFFLIFCYMAKLLKTKDQSCSCERHLSYSFFSALVENF